MGFLFMLKSMFPNVDWEKLEADLPAIVAAFQNFGARFAALEKQVNELHQAAVTNGSIGGIVVSTNGSGHSAS